MISQRFKRGQIWWYQSSGSIGDKENIINSKTRPMLIVSNDVQNRNSQYVIAIPLTTAEKKDYPTHTRWMVNGKQSTFLAESIQSCNKEYFSYYLETIDDELMKCIEENIRVALGFNLIPNDIQLIKLDPEVTEPKNVIEINPEKPKRGKKPIYTTDYKIRFINDYETHNKEFMLKKYNIAPGRTLADRVYKFRKDLENIEGNK